MLIQLDRIVFDHTPGAAANDALSIRIDRAKPAPDWIRGAADTSYAAYALVPTLNQQLSIHADFSFPDAQNQPGQAIEVRARAVHQSDRILGNVDATSVPLAGGQVVLPLLDVQLWERGVGRYELEWQWQFTLAGTGEWIDFERSNHIVYVTLDEPTAPWSQAQGASDRLVWPWARLLDWAGEWAAGVTLTSTGASGAARKIIRRLEGKLFELGRRDVVPVGYDGNPAYARETPDRVFALSAFLDLLDGTPLPEHGTRLNCSDCASALATFANVLGCTTLQKRIEHRESSSLRTNRIVLIGETESDPAETHLFGFHEVVVRERPSDGGLFVHDPCLQIDTDKDPTREHEGHDFDLAQGMELGTFEKDPGEYQYAHRLLKPEQWDKGELLPISFRCIEDCMGAANPPDPGTQRRQQAFRQEIDRLQPLPGLEWEPDLTPPVIRGFTLYNRVANPWRLTRMKEYVSQSAEFFYVANADGRSRHERLRVSMAYCKTPFDARELLAWLLAQSDAAVSPVREPGERTGEVAFRSARQAALFFVRGSAFTQIVNIGPARAPLAPIGREMDLLIQRLPHRTLRPQEERMMT